MLDTIERAGAALRDAVAAVGRGVRTLAGFALGALGTVLSVLLFAGAVAVGAAAAAVGLGGAVAVLALLVGAALLGRLAGAVGGGTAPTAPDTIVV